MSVKHKRKRQDGDGKQERRQVKQRPPPVEWIYTLKLQDGYFYVGKTNNVKERLKEHTIGMGSEWTKRHPPIMPQKVDKKRCKSVFDELNTTIACMKEHGILKVRGGPFTSPKISEEDVNVVKHIMASVYNTCYKCNQSGHYAGDCQVK